MITFSEYLTEDDGGGGEPANSTANVDGMRTEPVVRNSRLAKFFRRTPKIRLKTLRDLANLTNTNRKR